MADLARFGISAQLSLRWMRAALPRAHEEHLADGVDPMGDRADFRRPKRELSQGLRCTPRNVTGLFDALDGGGLVERRPHPTDRRATVVVLTGTGSELATTMDAGYRATARELFDDFDASELRSFVDGLDRVLRRMRGPDGR